MRFEARGPLTLGAAVLSFSTMSALAKLAGADIPSSEIVFFRGVFGLPVLLVLAWRKGVPLAGRRKGLLFARSAAGSVALMLLFFAVTRIPLADAILLSQTAPVFVLPLAFLVLKERVTWVQVLFIFVALAGSVLVLDPGSEVVNVPGLAALSAAICAATAYVLIRKLSATEHTLTIVVWFTVMSTLIAVPFMAPAFVVPSRGDLLVLLGMAAFGTIGQLLMTRAYSQGKAGRLAVIGSLGAVFGAGYDLLIFGHLPGMATIAGGLLIITSCTVIQIRTGRGAATGR